MKTAKQFLLDKGILKEGFTKWMIRFSDGREFDIAELMDEFIGNIEPKESLISEDYLKSLHPELTDIEAIEYLNFCNNKTIHHKNCYGDGSIMWPQWIEHKKNKV